MYCEHKNASGRRHSSGRQKMGRVGLHGGGHEGSNWNKKWEKSRTFEKSAAQRIRVEMQTPGLGKMREASGENKSPAVFPGQIKQVSATQGG